MYTKLQHMLKQSATFVVLKGGHISFKVLVYSGTYRIWAPVYFCTFISVLYTKQLHFTMNLFSPFLRLIGVKCSQEMHWFSYAL
uniref:Uncharacterized protein n=1 Tax=Anguilla anguilla TaxID=7936 RepID=A0A0E9X464_ANGAN